MPELQSNDIICVTYMANDVCAPFCISSTRQSVNSILKHQLDGNLCENVFDFHIFFFFGF